VSIPFVLEVQRQQAASSSNEAASGVAGVETIGTLVVSPARQASQFGSSSSSAAAVPEDETAAAAALGSSTAVASASTTTTDLVADESTTGGFAMRLSTGPLASRSGGALGPMLAAADAEPTEPVDRLERALAQEIGGSGVEMAGVDRDAALEFGRDRSDWPGSIGASGTQSPVVTVTGRGGVPLKVTSLGRDQGAGLAALWATLPLAADVDPSLAEGGESRIPLDELPSVPIMIRSRSGAGSPRFADYVKAACGLALGLGLTAGPLFPDLIASLPRRLPRWVAILRPRFKRRAIGRGSKGVAGRGRTGWLGGFFAS
jgi:hypothetical protein